MNNPKLYSDADARFDTVVGKHEYFELLRRIRVEFDNTTPYNSYSYEFDQGDFLSYVENHYGFQPLFDTTYQAITADYNIVDEKKYLLARLKFA
jgi:hypothetical protein